MFALAWDWIVAWLFGWGGIGAIVCAVAWAAWIFSPLFKTQLLQIAIAVTLFTLASTYFFTKGYDAGVAEITAQWDAANTKAKIAANARDDAIAADTETKVKQATDELQRQADDLQGRISDYVAQLAASKIGACVLTDDDVRRLRGF